MRKLRVSVVTHEDLVPPESMEGFSEEEIAKWKTDYDVITALKDLGHEVHCIGVSDDTAPLRREIVDWKPHVVFNLLEEFQDVADYDQYIVAFLELMRQPYTGCNPRGLLLSRDKVLSKKILTYHRISTPRFAVYPMGRAIRERAGLEYPLLVKSASEDASLGISQASIVYSFDKLKERIEFVHQRIGGDALAEEFVDGRELYVGIIGNRRLQTFPIWELVFSKMPDRAERIATAKVKWDRKYQQRHGIMSEEARSLPDALKRSILHICKRTYRLLNMSGYARLDFRLRDDGKLFLLEANANPNLSYGEDFAESAEKAGISYEVLMQKIVSLGMSYKPAWKRE